ncbi:hypothetical protein ACM39_18470 [Chryseobacterium sp. FH2]|nr:hypothetical protein ACM39_18470 [Chryseobacterium sp. FH2]
MGFCANAQSFTDKSLQQSVLQINTAKTAIDYDNLFKKFSESKTSEKWQAYYYAAVASYLKTDLLIKKGANQSLTTSNAVAGKFAMGALSSQQNNEEVQILLGLIYLQRVTLNASPNVQKDLNTVSEYISKVEGSASNNPRLAILKARVAEQANKTGEAESLYQKASKEFDTSASSSSLTPNWGNQLIQTIK